MGREVWTLQDKVLLVCYGSLYVGVLCALAGAPSPWLSGKLGPDRWLDQIPVVVATFVAAAAGGWAAFTAERRTREEAERKSRISAANKALFVIATMFNVFDNLRQFYIDAGDFRRSPNRVLMIDSPQPGMMQPLNFDFDSLNYFLEPDGDVSSMALMELQTLDWHYHLLVNTVELRASATEELHKAIKRAASAAFIDAEAAKGLAPSEYFKSEALTDQFIQLVDEGVRQTKGMYEAMHAALAQQFPTQNFLQVKFAAKPSDE